MSEGHVLHHDFEAATFTPAEVEEYIPLSLASKTIHDVTTEFTDYRTQQTAYADRLNTFYQNAISQTTQHYESLINTARMKAVRHIEIKQKQIEKLGAEIVAQNEKIDELRDNLAAMTLQHQEDEKSLKSHPAVQQLEEQARQHNIEVDRLTQSRQMAIEECQTLKSSLASLSQEKWEILAQNKILESEKQSLVDENLTLSRDMNALRETLTEQSAKMEVSDEDRLKMLTALEKPQHHPTLSEAQHSLSSAEKIELSHLQAEVIKLNCAIALHYIVSTVSEMQYHHLPLMQQNTYDPSTTIMECQRYAKSLTTIRDNLKVLGEKVKQANKVKESAKNSIKIWVAEFKAANGRDPDKTDKMVVKDRYVAYKNITTKLEEYEAEVKNLEKEEMVAEEAITNIKQITSSDANLSARIDKILSSNGKDDYGSGISSSSSVFDSPLPSKPSVQASDSLTTAIAQEAPTTALLATVSEDREQIYYYKLEAQRLREKCQVLEEKLSTVSQTGAQGPISDNNTLTISEEAATQQEEINATETPISKAVETSTSQQATPNKSTELINEGGPLGSKSEAVMEDAQLPSSEPPPASLTGQIVVTEKNEGDIHLIEKMEEEIYELKKDLKGALDEREKMKTEKDDIALHLENIIKEKRSDVIQRQEEELSKLRTEVGTLTETNSTLQTEKKKNDMKLAEFKERFEHAESELKLRSMEGNPADHRVQLMAQIGKQREDIVMKSKAATAGWVRAHMRIYIYI